MRQHERIPIHDHSNLDSGGLVATSTIVSVVGGGNVTASVSFANPVAVGTAIDDGTLGVAARADHVHTNAYLGTVLVSGTATAGYVLTADAPGSASWQAAGTAGGGGSVVWYDEGNLAGTASIVNITGSGGTVTVSGGTATITVSGGTAAGGSGSVVFYDEGTLAGTAAILNVVGSSGTLAVSGGTATLTLSGAALSQSYEGYNTAGGSTENMAGSVYAKQITPATGGLLASIDIYLKGNNNGAVKTIGVAVYTDASGTPSLLTAINNVPANSLNPLSANAARWISVPVGQWVSAGTCWIAWWAQANQSAWTLYYDGSGSDVMTPMSAGAGAPDWGTNTATSKKYSVRANFIR